MLNNLVYPIRIGATDTVGHLFRDAWTTEKFPPVLRANKITGLDSVKDQGGKVELDHIVWTDETPPEKLVIRMSAETYGGVHSCLSKSNFNIFADFLTRDYTLTPAATIQSFSCTAVLSAIGMMQRSKLKSAPLNTLLYHALQAFVFLLAGKKPI